jgi:hypothetical protein
MFYADSDEPTPTDDSYEAIAAVHTGQNGYWKVAAARSQDPPVPTCMRLACSVEDGRYANTAVYVRTCVPMIDRLRSILHVTMP